jgi:hypothetical protein
VISKVGDAVKPFSEDESRHNLSAISPGKDIKRERRARPAPGGERSISWTVRGVAAAPEQMVRVSGIGRTWQTSS